VYGKKWLSVYKSSNVLKRGNIGLLLWSNIGSPLRRRAFDWCQNQRFDDLSFKVQTHAPWLVSYFSFTFNLLLGNKILQRMFNFILAIGLCYNRLHLLEHGSNNNERQKESLGVGKTRCIARFP